MTGVRTGLHDGHEHDGHEHDPLDPEPFWIRLEAAQRALAVLG